MLVRGVTEQALSKGYHKQTRFGKKPRIRTGTQAEPATAVLGLFLCKSF